MQPCLCAECHVHTCPHMQECACEYRHAHVGVCACVSVCMSMNAHICVQACCCMYCVHMCPNVQECVCECRCAHVGCVHACLCIHIYVCRHGVVCAVYTRAYTCRSVRVNAGMHMWGCVHMWLACMCAYPRACLPMHLLWKWLMSCTLRKMTAFWLATAAGTWGQRSRCWMWWFCRNCSLPTKACSELSISWMIELEGTR